MVAYDMNLQAQKLAVFIQNKQFDPIMPPILYHHIGAIITDSVLQAGLNYRNVVYPRVYNLLTNYADYNTTSDFIILMQTIPLADLISWNNKKKLQLIHSVSWLLFNSKIESDTELSEWLNYQTNVEQLARLDGIGPKTIDYMKTLSGNPVFAIDRHLLNFLKLAGIHTSTYQEASNIYHLAAKILCKNEYELDKQIWNYMSMSSGECDLQEQIW